MSVVLVDTSRQKEFDRLSVHPLQSWAWGKFREQLGQKVVRLGVEKGRKLTDVVQFSVHNIPHTPWSVGYCPRGILPTKELLGAIQREAIKNKCVFVKFEPNVKKETMSNEQKTMQTNCRLRSLGLRPGKSLFTPFSFQLDLTQTEEQLLAHMKPKTRYNIKLAQKKGVVIKENNSDEAFEQFQKLTEETTLRQHFFAHNRRYRKLMWETMRKNGIAHLLTANYQGETLTAWVLFFWNGVGYYPYGSSSSAHRELMASNLLAWEALKLAKKSGCKTFDFWGSLGPNPDTSDPWYGFHRFKEGYGGQLVEFVGTHDLVINPVLYKLYTMADGLRWLLLRTIKYRAAR